MLTSPSTVAPWSFLFSMVGEHVPSSARPSPSLSCTNESSAVTKDCLFLHSEPSIQLSSTGMSNDNASRTTRRRPREEIDDSDNDDDDHFQPQRQRPRIDAVAAAAISTSFTYLPNALATLVQLLATTLTGRSLTDGTYFNTISDVWGTRAEGPFSTARHVMNALQRPAQISHGLQNCRHATARGGRPTGDPYSKTLAGLRNRDYDPQPEPSRTSHNEATAKRLIWPENVLGTSGNGEIAHLLPASPTSADTWWFIPPWLFGMAPRRNPWTWNVRRKAIHGFAETGRSRVEHTGIKHMVTNKARIAGQKTYMDDNPCLLIVPILTTQQVKEWNGSGYDAIVLIDKWEQYTLRTVAEGTGMNQIPGADRIASPGEIEMARELLVFFMRSVLTARLHRPRGTPDDNLHTGDNIAVPTKCTLPYPIVRKISFVAQSWESDADKHPAPDPTLLAARAAVVFSTRHGQRLAASAEPQEDGYWSDMDQQEAEEYLEWRETTLRAHIDADLASRIHHDQHPHDIQTQT